MSGSGLLGFIVSIIMLFGVAAIFFLTIDRVAKDAFLAQIAKIAVGCLLLVAFILAVANVLGFGGTAFSTSPMGIIIFAVGVLVLIVVLYIIDAVLDWIGANMGMAAPLVTIIKFVISVVALIALLLLAGTALLGGGDMNFLHGAVMGGRH
jgi:hypothetical protein